MNVLIVHAHPSPTSFNAALRDAMVEEAVRRGHAVEVSDLYAENFGAAGGPADFQSLQAPGNFHYQSEQRAAALGGTFSAEVAREQERLVNADFLIMQFPLWWGGPPAILKGWIDRVCAYGVTYADGTRFDDGLFKGRRSLISVTTGGTPRRFSDQGEYGPIEQVLWPTQHLFLEYLGYDLAPPHVSYAVARGDDASRQAMVDALRTRVREMLAPPIVAAPIPGPEELLASVGARSWNSAS
jgi:NAD(P)H dehydrogenase (quinone)